MAMLLGHEPERAREYELGDLERMASLYYENAGLSIK